MIFEQGFTNSHSFVKGCFQLRLRIIYVLLLILLTNLLLCLQILGSFLNFPELFWIYHCYHWCCYCYYYCQIWLFCVAVILNIFFCNTSVYIKFWPKAENFAYFFRNFLIRNVYETFCQQLVSELAYSVGIYGNKKLFRFNISIFSQLTT